MEFKTKPRPNLVVCDWSGVESFQSLREIMEVFIENKATLQSGRKNSFWKESESLHSTLLELVRGGFITLSSQPSLCETRQWQRYYITGICESPLAQKFIESLRNKRFLVLASTAEKSILLASPQVTSLQLELPPADAEEGVSKDDRIVLPEDLLPLTLLKQGINRWNPVNSIPLPFHLAQIAEMDSVVEIEDEGELFRFHIKSNFKGRLSPKNLEAALASTTLVTAIYPEWSAPVSEVNTLVSSCLKEANLSS